MGAINVATRPRDVATQVAKQPTYVAKQPTYVAKQPMSIATRPRDIRRRRTLLLRVVEARPNERREVLLAMPPALDGVRHARAPRAQVAPHDGDPSRYIDDIRRERLQA